MLNLYQYYDKPLSLLGIDQYKQKLISRGDIEAMVEFARDDIKGRWPEAEPYIMKSPWYAPNYARDVIKGRWPEAEPAILTDIGSSYGYAKDVLKSRWPEAESRIKSDKNYWAMYKHHFGIE